MRFDIMGVLQKIGRSLMMPIAVLPAAALLLRFGAGDMLALPVMEKAGDAVFANLPLIFAIGVAIGFTTESGVAGLAAVVGYLVLTATTRQMNDQIDMGVLAGIIVGLVAAAMYERYRSVRLPKALGFFGGRRFVPLVTALACFALGLFFGAVWPPIQEGMNSAGNWLLGAGAVGVALYGFLNRLLIPIGLHHILNNLIWLVFGTFQTPGGPVHGELKRFIAGDPNAGFFMAGFYPIMMFGLPAACLAMYHEAKPSQKKLAGGILFSSALASLITGITEPIEFTFMFLAPALYGVHALLTGSALAVCWILGVRHGFSFSAGAIDYLLFWKLADKPALIVPLGLAYGLIYYLLFRIIIRKFDLPTPGRTEEEGDGGRE